jgi:hypothetical protein
MAEIVRATCPECKRPIRVPVELIDKRVRCRHCNAVIRPKHEEATAPPPSRPQAPKPALPATPPPPEAAPEPIIRLASPPRRSPIVVWLRRGVTLGLAVFAIVLVVSNREHLQTVGQDLLDSVGGKKETSSAVPEKVNAKPAQESASASEPVYPRRLLAIFPCNYLYANHVSPGTFDRSFASVLQHFVHGLHIDPSQVLVVSDETADTAAPSRKNGKKDTGPSAAALRFPRVIPTRTMIEKACAGFLAASRPQDRVVLLFIGHATVIDSQCFLAPLEGDLDNKETLIPLSWLLEKLGQCKARQKVLVLDSFRRDPGRGVDRPASGPMPAEFAKALEQAPAGVEVWAPCQADQYSYEIDGQSVFLDKICEALESPRSDKPEEALCASDERNAIQAKVEGEVAKALKAKQGTLWTGKMAEQGASFDPQEHLPAQLILMTPEPDSPPAADADIRQILRELKLPPIQLSAVDDGKFDLEGIVFFARDKLAPYLPDYRSLDDIRRQSAKYPLRIAVLNTLDLLETEFASAKARESIRQFYPAAGMQGAKNRIMDEQKKPAQLLLRLQEARAKLEKAGEEREEEKSKRWQAHFDYTLAELLARIAFLEEYNLMLGRIRKDELPELEKGVDEGWRLTPREKLQSPKDVRDLATQAHKLFAKVAKDHAGTPWEVLARREAATSLGLQWQPAKR